MSMYSNYLLEVLINNRPAKMYQHNGQEFIEGRKGTEFTLRFRNKSAYRVLAIFSIDGLDVVEGKPASEKSRGYVVNAHGYVDIPGWRINGDKVAKFEFAPQSDKQNKTYVEELRMEGFNVDPSNQGVIGVMVFTEKQYVHPYSLNHLGAIPNYIPRGIPISSGGSSWTLGSKTDHWEERYQARGIAPQSLSANASASLGSPVFKDSLGRLDYTREDEKSLGTAWGEETKFHTTNTTFERANDYPAYTQVIFYDTLTGLRKRGVPVDPVMPNAFPASPYVNNDGAYVPRSKR